MNARMDKRPCLLSHVAWEGSILRGFWHPRWGSPEEDAMAARVLVTGAGGFIGHHMVQYLLSAGHWVRGVDIKEPGSDTSAAHESELLDPRRCE